MITFDIDKLDELHKRLPEGKENAVTRKDLAQLFGTDDRRARDILHEIRNVFPVCSNTGKGGYYRPATVEEANAFVNQQLSYIKSINRTIGPVKRYSERSGQRRIAV